MNGQLIMRILQPALAVMLLGASVTASAQTAQDDESTPVGIIEKLGDFLSADLTFAAEDGSPVRLGELIDKPTILSLVYYECPSICGPLLNSLRDTIELMMMDTDRTTWGYTDMDVSEQSCTVQHTSHLFSISCTFG